VLWHTAFRRWCEALKKDGIRALFIMDNAAYHWTPMEDGNVSTWSIARCKKHMADRGLSELQPRPGKVKVMLDDLKAVCREHVVKHRNFWVYSIAAEFGHYVLSLPPYHPGGWLLCRLRGRARRRPVFMKCCQCVCPSVCVAELNPIEGVWSLMKNSLRAQAAAGVDAVATAGKLKGAVEVAAKAISKEAMIGLWKRSMDFFVGFEEDMVKEAADLLEADAAPGAGFCEDDEVDEQQDALES